MIIHRTVLVLVLTSLTIIGCKNESGEKNTDKIAVVKDSIQTKPHYSFHKTLALKNISFDITTIGEGSLRQLSIQCYQTQIKHRHWLRQH